MSDDLKCINLGAAKPSRVRHIVVVDNHETHALNEIATKLGSSSAVSYRHVPSFAAWVDDVDKGLVPHNVIEAIITWLNEVFG
jgi:hypothetical protein